MDYDQFLSTKYKRITPSGFEAGELNSKLFTFQDFIVRRALKAGKYAIFADCGLGKTFMQLEWAYRVQLHTSKRVLILCPLAVAAQTKKEAVTFGIDMDNIDVVNYEQLNNVPDLSVYSGVVLDESSILKNFTGVYKNLIIDSFKDFDYKLACTATPAPNDLNEIGNHSEFLDVMDAYIMRMRWFVRDEGANNYRLKGHAESEFFGWISTWASVLRKPSDVGYDDGKYVLPPLHFYDHKVSSDMSGTGMLFPDANVSATTFNSELRATLVPRMELAAELVNNSSDPWIVWINQDAEDEAICAMIPDAVSVRGSETPQAKERKLLGFANGDFRVLVTKKKIAQFGLNYQHCNNQIFASLDFSFEGLYQAIRRSYRFGQTKDVNIYIVTTDSMMNVKESIDKKQATFNNMMDKITSAVNGRSYDMTHDYSGKKYENEHYTIVNGDCCELIRQVPSDSIDFSVFSPPFSNIFTYSDNMRDMGNSEDHNEFFQHTEFLLSELYRIIKPGRLAAVHTKDLAVYKNSSGYSGMYDFTGDYHRAMERAGFKYHSKVTIWIDPVLEMQRTKTQRLLYKQLTSDSSYSGIGMPEYVTIFRKWEGDEAEWEPITNKTKENFALDTWQQWASPVWMDIDRTNVLNSYRDGTTEKDEKHICPLQLDVIERCIGMWSNPGETVFTPFLGIGSEVYQAVLMGRNGIGFELKESYFDQARKNLEGAMLKKAQASLF